MDKYQVQAQLCESGKECSSEQIGGSWSPVYDQSLEIELDNGLRFLSNFKYTIKSDISKNPQQELMQTFSGLKTGDYAKFDSHCDQTMVGFVQTMPSISKETYSMTNHNVVCFYGKQETHYDMEKTVSVKTDSDTVKVAVITQQNKIVTTPDESNNIQMKEEQTPTPSSSVKPKTGQRKPSNRFNAHAAHAANDETDKAISFINSQNLGWKADTCKFQKHHPEYGTHCDNQNF
jgi:hypothetical protein